MDRSRMLQELNEVLDDGGCQHTAWTDDTKLGYLEEGQEKFCEDTGFFVDNSNFQIVTEVGVAAYAVDPRIIQVLDVFDGGRRLALLPMRYRDGQTQDPFLSSVPFAGTSTLRAYQLDLESGRIVFHGAPTDVRTLQLRVWRYPMFELSNNDVDGQGTPAEPELPRRLQRACIEWAAFKCLSHHDREQQDPVKAVDHLGMYRQYVSDGRQYLRRLKSDVVDIQPNAAYRVC